MLYLKADYVTRVVGVRERIVVEERLVPQGQELREKLNAAAQDFVAGKLKPRRIDFPRRYQPKRHVMLEMKKQKDAADPRGWRFVGEPREMAFRDVMAAKLYEKGLEGRDEDRDGRPVKPEMHLALVDGTRLVFTWPPERGSTAGDEQEETEKGEETETNTEIEGEGEASED